MNEHPAAVGCCMAMIAFGLPTARPPALANI